MPSGSDTGFPGSVTSMTVSVFDVTDQSLFLNSVYCLNIRLPVPKNRKLAFRMYSESSDMAFHNSVTVPDTVSLR